ncbi:MAG: App1 family protein [Planctomycetales bacterium]|nr:App1 family protein [Planctomycetales bacterium]
MALFPSRSSSRLRTVACHEQVVFYPSYAARTEDGEGWSLVVQGRVFDPRISWFRRKPMLAVVKRVLRFDHTSEGYFRSRMRQFLMSGLRGRSVTVKIGDHERLVAESDYMGLFRGTLTLTTDEVAQLAGGTVDRNVWLPFGATLPVDDPRVCLGQLQLIEPTGTSIISDVDDTIKHSNVPNRRDLFRNTFMRTFTPVTGMPELYRACAEAGAAFHFVSGSPWQLYEPLAEFLRTEGYPAGSFHLKRFRIRDSARKLRRSPQKAHKHAAIEPIVTAFPQRRFILIGDSGEQDSEIYGSFLRERPHQIAGIFIRAIKGETRDTEKFRAAFEGLDPARWTIYRHPAEMRDAVIRLVKHDG